MNGSLRTGESIRDIVYAPYASGSTLLTPSVGLQNQENKGISPYTPIRHTSLRVSPPGVLSGRTPLSEHMNDSSEGPQPRYRIGGAPPAAPLTITRPTAGVFVSPSPFTTEPIRTHVLSEGQEGIDGWERVNSSARSIGIVRRIEFTTEKKKKEMKDRKNEEKRRNRTLLLR